MRQRLAPSLVMMCLGWAGCSSSDGPAEPQGSNAQTSTFRPPSAGAPSGASTAGTGPGGAATAGRSGAGGAPTAGRSGAGDAPTATKTTPTAGPGGAGGRAATGGTTASPGSTGANTGGAGAPATATSDRPAVDPTQEAAEQPGGGLIREADPTEDSVRKNGEFMVKSYTETDGLIGGTAYGDAAIAGDGSELYYPEGATPPFASMAIVPGFTAQRSDVAQWGPLLASHGIVALVLDTNTVGDTPDIRAVALLDAIESLKKENMREGSPVKGKLDTSRIGLMGWSMGGGGTWLSADAHPELKVAVSLCGWTLDFVGSTTKVPSLQLAAELDELAAGMSQPVYAAIPDSTPKMLVEWAGEGHWINNDPTSRANQVGRYGLPWIKVFLEGDERYRKFFSVMPEGASDFQTNQ